MSTCAQVERTIPPPRPEPLACPLAHWGEGEVPSDPALPMPQGLRRRGASCPGPGLPPRPGQGVAERHGSGWVRPWGADPP